MRFGIDAPNYGRYGDPGLLVDLACESEAAGWDGFFVWDHLHGGGRSAVADPWVVMAAIAARTDSIRFGPMVTPLARRRPSKVARETVSLDHLSNGRLVLGVGLGSQDDREFGDFGDQRSPKVRAEMLDEGLDVVTGLWSGLPFSHDGSHFTVKGTTFAPPPVQEPRIPIWVAGQWPNRPPMRRAAAWDGVFPIARGASLNSMMSPEEMAACAAFVRDHRSSPEPFDLIHAGVLTGDQAEDRRVVDEYESVGVTWWLEHISPSRLSPAQLRKLIQRGPPR